MSLLAVPAIIKVLGTLLFILLVTTFARQLLLAIGGGIVVLALWCGLSPAESATIAWERFSSTNNVSLLLIVFLVVWLSSQMAATGMMSDLVSAVRQRLTQRSTLAALPAIIGMLPMPGGAIFSAPLVDRCDEEKRLDGPLKTRINYWFRHVWEYWWPLYPGVLLAVELSGFEIWQFMLLQLPLTVFAVVSGWAFILRKVPRQERRREDDSSSQHRIPALVAPLLTVIALYVIVRIAFPGVARLSKYLPMAIGLVGGIALQQCMRPLSSTGWKKIVLSRRTLLLAAVVAAVRVYGAFIEADPAGSSSLVEQMRIELDAWGIPVLALLVVIPFISGLTTGLAIGFVGASFPIVFSLLGPEPALAHRAATVVLAYAAGYAGMILSPVHVCLVVTNEHFRTNLGQSIVHLVKPVAVVAVAATLLAGCYYVLLPG